jgi:transcriptional regulator with XRE-family HTH domain
MENEKRYISGESVRALRSVRKISQKEMADRLNMTQGNFSRLERDKIKIKGERLQLIAAILGYNVEFLIDFDADRAEIEGKTKDVYKGATVHQEVLDIKVACDQHLYALESLTATFKEHVQLLQSKILSIMEERDEEHDVEEQDEEHDVEGQDEEHDVEERDEEHDTNIVSL